MEDEDRVAQYKLTDKQTSLMWQRIGLIVGIIALFALIFFLSPSEIRMFIPLIAIGILIFLAIREVLCWYWKLNQLVYNQERQTEHLQQVVSELQALRRIMHRASIDDTAHPQYGADSE